MKCFKCQEPVGQGELEKGAIVICPKCILNWALSPPLYIDLASLEDYQATDRLMANELAAQFEGDEK